MAPRSYRSPFLGRRAGGGPSSVVDPVHTPLPTDRMVTETNIVRIDFRADALTEGLGIILDYVAWK